jgi:hypothetical protein
MVAFRGLLFERLLLPRAAVQAPGKWKIRLAATGQEQPLKVPALGAMLGGALTVYVLIN